MRALVLLPLMAVFALVAAPAAAHKPSDSYLKLTVTDDTVSGEWDIALRDLDYAIGLDTNDDGAITWGELRTQYEAIAAYALPRLKIDTGGEVCPTRLSESMVNNHSDGAYAVLRFAVDCTGPLDNLAIGYRLFFDLDPQHRGLIRVDQRGTSYSAVLSPEANTWRVTEGGTNLWTQFYSFARDGVWHIWIGYDHVLFLITLLLPSVLRRRDGRWEAMPDLGGTVLDVLKVVTAFTVAHSVTLSLAALSVISLPSRLVESVIAVSVIVAALNNLYPLVVRRLWAVAFVFGLVHGFGFASVLADLGLPRDSLLLSLVGFNLGVEIGQLAIVSLFLPVAFWLRGWRLYPQALMPAGSFVIALVASLWFAERAFGLTLLAP